MKEMITRAVNGIRKVAAGLRPFSESVWPGVRNDLFVVHESIYEFFARYADGRSILDAGCGTGYGAFMLASANAQRVAAVDIDPRNIAFARRRYHHPRLEFDIADLEKLSYPGLSFDLIVASNSLEHLHDPSAFVSGMRRMLRDGATALIAVPPIYSLHDVTTHKSIHYHRTNLSIAQWAELFERGGWHASCFSHRCTRRAAPDFRRHTRSELSTADFIFTPTSLQELCSELSITAIFVLQGAG